MPIRVISGRAKGRKLKRVPGDTTRPIMDRVKESLFNILGTSVVGQTWVDLFAGTGQVGIEALSRGAAEVIFIDNGVAAIKTVRANLESTGLGESAVVIQSDAFGYLRDRMRQSADVIFVAPPQYKGLWHEALRIVDAEPDRYLKGEGQVIIQIDPREYQDLTLDHLALADQRRYGNTLLCFYEVAETI